MKGRASLVLLALVCSQGVLAQDRVTTPTPLTVGAGDTATGLAQKLRPEGATLEQTLVALWRANPRAFGNGNLNQLLQGATLQVPNERDILRMSAAQAHALVVEQVENFQTFTRQQNRSATASPAASTGLDALQWRRALAEAQALKDALERQNRDTQSRLTQLEKNIQTLQAMQPAASPASTTPTTPAASMAAQANAQPMAPAAVEASVAEASAPQADASRPTSEPAAVAASTPEPASASTPVVSALASALPQVLPWTGAWTDARSAMVWAFLLVLLLMLAWVIRQRRRSTSRPPAAPIDIPPQMARIDLNLDSPPSGAAPTPDTRP